MAREKLSSFNADDAVTLAGGEERGAISVTERNHGAQTKKKVSGKRSGDMTGGGGGTAGGGGGGASCAESTASSAVGATQSPSATGHVAASRKSSGASGNAGNQGTNVTGSSAASSQGPPQSKSAPNSTTPANNANSSNVSSLARSNKTLGWYLNDGLFQKSSTANSATNSNSNNNSNNNNNNNNNNSNNNNNAVVGHQSNGHNADGQPSSNNGYKNATASITKHEGVRSSPETAMVSSDASKEQPPTSRASMMLIQNATKNGAQFLADEEKKRGRRTRQRQSKKVVAVNVNVNVKPTPEVTGEVEEPAEVKVAPRSDCKDDYWYYDPSSDGYYYEQMGSRGWRRRAPVGERKRLQFEQEVFSALLRDPSAYAHVDPYGYAAAAAAAVNPTFFTPQIKYYDAASDGYYFEMPSVDGWKKRQPNSNSTSSSSGASSNSSSYKAASVMPNFAHAVLSRRDLSHTTSYGAALARGQMPPATCMISANGIPMNPQDPFSSGASSRSTLSSLSEGTPTPPPMISSDRTASLFADDEALDEYLAEQYDRALDLDDLLNDECEEWKVEQHGQQQRSNLVGKSVPQKVLRKSGAPATYADVAAAAFSWETAAGDTENKPPGTNITFKRPNTLQFRTALEDSTWCAQETKMKEKNSNHELLLNFNADKFIADLSFCGTTNTERVLRDLAALKTPVALNSQVCSLESPHTPAVNFGTTTTSTWSRPIPTNTNSNRLNDDWWPSDLKSSSYIEDIWASDSGACSSAKSKLSIWRDAGLYAGVPVDGL